MIRKQRDTQSQHRKRRPGSIGNRLALLLLPLTLIPLLLMASGAYLRSRDILKTQANNNMLSAVAAQMQVLDEWLSERETRLYLGSQRQELRIPLTELIATGAEEDREKVRAALQNMLVLGGRNIFSDLLIAEIDPQGSIGQVLASTDPTLEGSTSPSFSLASTTETKTIPLFNLPDLAPDSLTLMTSIPIRLEGEEQRQAIIIGLNDSTQIATLLASMQVFWEERGVYRVERGATYLLMSPDILIELPRYATTAAVSTGISHPIFRSAQSDLPGTLEYETTDETAVLGAYQWIPAWNIAVVVELPQKLAFEGLYSLAPFSIALLAISILIVGLVVPWVVRRGLRPLEELAQLAERFAAGEMDQRFTYERHDEVGRLTTAINYMADELSQLYRGLERRVHQRTQEILVASEVAREAASIREVKELIEEAVNRIRDRFDFYHVGLFLIDRERQYAELRAASSEGGRRMLERGHRLPVGETGVVGYVTHTGRPHVANDVSQDSFHYANPDLPETKAELAIPLLASGQVIGAIDVQSARLNAFTETDLMVLQIIADQLAIALHNARLLEQQDKLIVDRQKVIDLYRQLGQETSFEALVEQIPKLVRQTFGYRRVTLGLLESQEMVIRSVSASEEATRSALPELSGVDEYLLALSASSRMVKDYTPESTSDMATLDPRKAFPHRALALPLMVRDDVIGSLAIETHWQQSFDASERETLELLTSQIAITLENTRLLEEMKQNLEHMDAIYRQQAAAGWEAILQRREDLEESVLQVGSGLEPNERTRPAMEAPIKVRGEIIGHMDLLGTKLGGWTDDDRVVLEAVADELAGALEQARLVEEINRRVAQLQTAAEIARNATSLLEVESLLAQSVDLIRDRFGYYYAGVFLVDEEHNMAILKGATGEAGQRLLSDEHALAIDSSSIIGHVAESGESHICNNTEQDPYYWQNPMLGSTRSEMGLAMKIGEQVIGVLDVQHTRPQAFNDEDASILQILADQLAIAVQNARLFQDAVQRADREKTITRITSRLRSTREVDAMLQTALEEMQQALHAERGEIRLVLAEEEERPKGQPASHSSSDVIHETQELGQDQQPWIS